MSCILWRLALILSVVQLFAACGFVPCSRTTLLLDDVESYIDERPDSAMMVLKAMDTLSIQSSRIKARYSLLMAIALDKNYVDDGSFLPEMDRTAEWYALHGNTETRARSLYYLGDQQKDAGEYAKAAVNFSLALNLAESLQDWFLAGIAARNLSDIYLSGYDYPRSMEFARKSVDCFSKTEKIAHYQYARIQLAESFYNNGLLDACIRLCDSLRTETAEVHNLSVFAESMSVSAMAYIQTTPPRPDSTIILLDKVSELYPLSAQKRAIYAWACCLQGDMRQAKEMIMDAYRAARTAKDTLYVNSWAAKVMHKLGDIEQYALLQEEIVRQTDIFSINTILHSVNSAQVQYLQQQRDLQAQRMLRDRITWLVFLGFVVLLCSFLLVLAGMQKQRIDEKNRTNEQLAAKLTLYGSTVEETLDFGFDVLNKLSDAFYHPNTNHPDAFRSILQSYVSDVASRTRLSDAIEQNINIIHDDVIAKLRREVPALKEKDIKLFSLYLFGFSYKAISEFFPEYSSINSTYSRVSRMRKTIVESGSDHAVFFLSFLERSPFSSYRDPAKNATSSTCKNN